MNEKVRIKFKSDPMDWELFDNLTSFELEPYTPIRGIQIGYDVLQVDLGECQYRFVKPGDWLVVDGAGNGAIFSEEEFYKHYLLA
jgi:hypothetical protein